MFNIYFLSQGALVQVHTSIPTTRIMLDLMMRKGESSLKKKYQYKKLIYCISVVMLRLTVPRPVLSKVGVSK